MRAHEGPLLSISFVCLMAGCASPEARPYGDNMIIAAIEDARFVPANPANPNGAQIAVLSGDPRTGPSTMLMRLKKGGGTPHVHSSDYQLVVLQGTVKHLRKGQAVADGKLLNPGSYWYQPGGETHGDPCLSDECLVFIVWAGKQDGRLATEADR